MPYYLTTFTGTGTREDSFVPLGAPATGNWSTIDLSPKGQGDGWCLLYTETTLALTGPLAGVVFLADNPDDAIPNGVRNAINNRLGTAIPAGTAFRQIVRRLLTVEAGGAGKWAKLRAVGGRFDVALGTLADSWDEQ